MTAANSNLDRWRTRAAWIVMAAFGVFALMLDARPTRRELAADLRAAATSGNLAKLDQALLSGAPVDWPDEVGTTALIEAARAGRCDVIRALLCAGADINRPAPVLGTPLMQAVLNSQIDATELLMENGADATICNEYGNDALSFARSAADPRIVGLLQQHVPNRESCRIARGG